MLRHTVITVAASLAFAAPAGAQDRYTFIDVAVPSSAAGTEGVAVRIAAPSSPRFPEGAPVAIYVPGGGGTDAYEIRDHAGGGIVELTFAFPGGELDGRVSGGSADGRGPLALRALADVVEYALGRTRDAEGFALGDRLSYPVAAGNVGLIGWSRGGDSAINALARYPGQTTGVAWVLNHESPAFDAAMLGEIVLRPGSTYAASDYVEGSCPRLSCEIAYANIRWDGRALYLDRNGNGRRDSAEASMPATLLAGSTRRVFSLSATLAASAAGAFGARWPDSIATVDEARDHWAVRDVRHNLASLVTGHPTLAVMIHATTADHVQSSADHAHVALVYSTLTMAGARWVRINPDSAYSAGVAPDLPDTDANAPLVGDITPWLVPEALSNDTEIAQAGLYELVDRTRYVRWDVNLSSVIR